MSITKEQQQALDNALVPREQRLTIGSCNYRLSTTFKPKEPTFQVALDVLSFTPFYPAFLITASVPAVYMHEFWATASYHKHSIKFKLNIKSYSFDLDTLRNMLQMCLKLPGQKFVDPPFEEDILTFMRELGYSENIKLLSDVKVEILPQHWRTFGTIINKCISGKDLIFQIKNKESKKTKYMFYPRFTKVIINHFMSQDQSIPRRNKVDWHMANNDPILTTMRFIPQHEVVQKKAIPKPKYVRRSTKEKTVQAPEASSGKRLKATAKKSSDEDDDDEASISKDDDDNQNDDDDDKNDQDDDDERTESDNDGDEFVHPKLSTFDEEEHDEEDKEEETQGANVEEEKLDEEQTNEEEEVNLHLEGRDTEMTDAPRTIAQTTQVIEDTHVTITSVNPEGQHQSSSVSSGFVSNMLNPNPDTVPSSSLENLPNFGSLFGFDHRLKTLENDFSEFKQTNQFAEAISSILGIVDKYLADRMNNAVNTAVQLQSNRLREQTQAENQEFINTIDEGINKIIKEQVKEQVSKILPRIEKLVNDQLEAEVLIRSSNVAKSSHAVAANLSEMELKKILIEKMENNKSINRSDQQKNLYNALVEAYEADKDILDTYGDTVTIKRRLEDKDDDEEPSAGSDRGTLAQKEDTRESFNELMDTPLDFSAFVMNRLKVDTLTPELLAGPTFELMKVIPFDHFINNDLAYLKGGVSSRTYATSVTKTKAADYGHIKWIEELVPNTMESAHDVYSRQRIITVIELQIVEWHIYKYLDWITVRRIDNKLYKLKEGDFKRLRVQDIEDMLLLLIQGKLTNLTVEERLAFNNKDRKNRLMRIDELQKFSDGTLNDVRTTLDDTLKGIQMKYVPRTI
ncbi:hypothetical protein Tco_1230673 [Tanacetum coccineum]